MIRFVLRRLGHGLLLLAGVSVLSFGFTVLAPGDYFDEMRLDPRYSPERVEALRQRYGVDRPLPERYWRWLGSVARGDLGFSFAQGSPVAPLLAPRAKNTLLLSGTATAVAWLVAVPLGVWIAASRRRWPAAVAGGATSLLLALPRLVVALGLLLLAVRTGWFPAGDMRSLDAGELGALGRLADLAHHLVLPVAALVAGMVPLLLRHVTAAVGEVLRSPFLRAARGFGLSRRRLLFRYALPVAANPLVTLFGLSLAGLLSASLLVEVVMAWPGVGPFLLEAIRARDVHVVIGTVMLGTTLLVAGNLVADLMLYAVDPRIRSD